MAASGDRRRRRTPPNFRVFFDANVWVAYLTRVQLALPSSAVTALVDRVFRMSAGLIPVQLVASHELLDTLDRVLQRLAFSDAAITGLRAAIIGLMGAGPESLDPDLLLAGRDQLAMHDREDAGILASCIASRAHLLVTDNIRDFETNDSERIDTIELTRQDGSRRQLYVSIHEREDGVSLVVMHPVDALSWLRAGRRPTPGAVRKRYALVTPQAAEE